MASFNNYASRTKIDFVKTEFVKIVKLIFDHPETLKTFIDNKIISNEQSKIIFAAVNTLNAKSCGCCRLFDRNKLSLKPIKIEFEMLLDIAKTTAQSKEY
jgi:hypothetical protein